MKITKGILLIASLLAIGSVKAQMSNINEDIANTVNLHNQIEETSVGSTIDISEPTVQEDVQADPASETAPENLSAYNPSYYENADIDATKEQIESLQIRIAQMKEEIAALKSKVGPNK